VSSLDDRGAWMSSLDVRGAWMSSHGVTAALAVLATSAVPRKIASALLRFMSSSSFVVSFDPHRVKSRGRARRERAEIIEDSRAKPSRDGSKPKRRVHAEPPRGPGGADVPR
jgi:hypothetical protein